MKVVVVFLVIAVLTLVGDYYLKLASQRDRSFATVAFVVGLIVYGSTAVGWVFVMKHMTLASIGVWYSMVTILLLTALGVFVFGESFTARDGLGIALAFAALVTMSRFA
jgi:small multidrug resistance pump